MATRQEVWERLYPLAVRLSKCEYCLAEPGERCHVPGEGNKGPYSIMRTHWDRVKPLWEVWDYGYVLGVNDTRPEVYKAAYEAGTSDGFRAGVESMKGQKRASTPEPPTEADKPDDEAA